MDPLKLVHNCYNTKYLKLIHSHTLLPINGDDMWAIALSKPLTAPYFPPKKKLFWHSKGALNNEIPKGRRLEGLANLEGKCTITNVLEKATM